MAAIIIDTEAFEKELEKQQACSTCGVKHFSAHFWGQDCFDCKAKKEKVRWDALTVEQKLDELKARLDNQSFSGILR